jgi:hypothetical protein
VKAHPQHALFLVALTVLCRCSSSDSDRSAMLGAGGATSASPGGIPNTTSGAAGTGVSSLPASGGSAPASGGAVVSGGASGAASGGTVDAGGNANASGAGGTANTPGAGGAAAAGSGGAPVNGGAAGSGAAGAPGAGSATMKPYKGVANSPCAARTALNVSWYYNWEQKETEPCSDGRGGEFVPMIWGHTGAEQTGSSIQSAVQSMAMHGYANVLGFNEPDNSSQSNISVSTAIGLWPSFAVSGIRIGSPATSANSNGQAWFKDFMGQLGSDQSLRADFVAIHWYGWNSGSCDSKASQLESYVKWAEGVAGNRPIWITEWGCLNQSAPDAATVVTFYKAAVAMFAKHPRVERYSWYPWSTNCDLNDKSGALTELGMAYAAAPAFK